MIRICTQFEPHELVMEVNSGESEVDIALYRTTEQRIDDYIRSGEVLEDTRRLQYHSDYLDKMVDNPEWTDPLLYRGYDRLDLENFHKEAMEEIYSRMLERQKLNDSVKVENEVKTETEDLKSDLKESAENASEVSEKT